MVSKEKVRELQRHLEAWALWAFWGSDYARGVLSGLNPKVGCRQLIVPFNTILALSDDVLDDLYDRLHDRGSELECQPPVILQDLCRALRPSIGGELILV